MEKLELIFKDPEHAARYVNGPPRFVPGYDGLHRIMAQLLRERLTDQARVLVVGAGGGLELQTLGAACVHWRYVGVDPSAEMIVQAQRLLGEGAQNVTFVEGYVFDAPEEPFDAATLMLTLHFVPDDGAKLATLKAIRARLKPAAPFFLAHMCVDKTADDAPLQFDRYAQFFRDSGTDPEQVKLAHQRVSTQLNCVSQSHDEALLKDAGFQGVELVFAGLSWRGWVCYA